MMRRRLAGRGLPKVEIEHLWTILALTSVGAFVSLTPTPPHDFWWHLKAGQIIAASGIPTSNLFAWSLPAETPYVYATWLGEWLFYALYSVGGPQAPVVARNLLGLAAFALVAVEARRRSGSWRLAALAVLLAGAMSSNNVATRTQNWSWVPFALFALVLGAYAKGQVGRRALVALPLLMAFWVNVHGGFVLGLALVTLVALGETARALLRQAGAPSWGRLRGLYLAAAATFGATLLNPLGPGIHHYVARMLTDPPSQGLIVEWQPPTVHGFAGSVFFASVIALLIGFAVARTRPTLTDVLLVCAFLWLAWTGQRYVIWYGMLVMPVLAQSLAAARISAPRPVRPSGLYVANVLVTLVLLGVLVAVQPPLKWRLNLPAAYRGLFAEVPDAPELYSADTPVAAAEYLRSHPVEGRLFNEMGYGSYLSWALYPDTRVFIDPRVELYPLELWRDYLAIQEARGHDSLLIDKYDVRRVVLDRFRMPKLAAALAADPRWRREYADARAEVYRRR